MIPSVIVITAYSDENQFEACKRSVSRQKNVDLVDHIIISGLGAKAAEQKIYEKSKEHSTRADFILRLDADMVLQHDEVIANMVFTLTINQHLGRLTLPVFDFFLQQDIIGAHIFRTSHVPETYDKTDPRPEYWIDEINGLTIKRTKTRNITHAFNPSLSQAMRFGVNRALKAVDFGPRHDHWLVFFKLATSRKRTESIEAALYGWKIVMSSMKTEEMWHHNDTTSESWQVLLSEFEQNQHTSKIPLLKYQKIYGSFHLIRLTLKYAYKKATYFFTRQDEF